MSSKKKPEMMQKDCCTKHCSSLSLFYVISLFLVIAWMGIIFSFSAEPAHDSSRLSQGVTMQVLRQVQEKFPQMITEDNIEFLAKTLETPVRKLAHFTEYAVLGLLLSLHLTLRNGQKMGIATTFSAKKSIVIGCLYAMTDEFHQIFVPGRSGRLFDVGVDTAGAAFGTLIFLCIFFIIKKVNVIYSRKKEIKL